MKSLSKPTTPPITKPLFIVMCALLLALTSCDNGAQQKRQKDLDDLNAYIRNQKDSIDLYADKNWDEIERNYNEKKAALEQDTARMSQEMRTSYYQSVSDWNTYKVDFEKKAEEKKTLGAMDELRKSLATDGARTDFTDLTAATIVPAYQHFVVTVKTHKDEYTKEQWTVVNVSWKALKGRKREIAKDIKPADMTEIAKQELEYAGVKAANRPFADSEDDLK